MWKNQFLFFFVFWFADFENQFQVQSKVIQSRLAAIYKYLKSYMGTGTIREQIYQPKWYLYYMLIRTDMSVTKIVQKWKSQNMIESKKKKEIKNCSLKNMKKKIEEYEKSSNGKHAVKRISNIWNSLSFSFSFFRSEFYFDGIAIVLFHFTSIEANFSTLYCVILLVPLYKLYSNCSLFFFSILFYLFCVSVRLILGYYIKIIRQIYYKRWHQISTQWFHRKNRTTKK